MTNRSTRLWPRRGNDEDFTCIAYRRDHNMIDGAVARARMGERIFEARHEVTAMQQRTSAWTEFSLKTEAMGSLLRLIAEHQRVTLPIDNGPADRVALAEAKTRVIQSHEVDNHEQKAAAVALFALAKSLKSPQP